CFERLPEILHELQAGTNGCLGVNSPNLSGKNFKNYADAAAYCENLDGEKEGCRKSFSGVEQGENGYRAAQSVEAEGGTQSGVKNLAKCGTGSSVSDSAQDGVQGGTNDDYAGVEGFGSSAQIGDYAGASSIKYRMNLLATDAASFSEKFDDNFASQYDANYAETANCNLNLSSKCSESSNFDTNRGAGLDVSCEEKKSLNLGENFDSSCRKSLHSSANFVYDSRKNSTANSDGNFAASCKENSRPNVNLTRGLRKNSGANSRENLSCGLGESSTANDLGKCSAANSSESHTANSSENSVSDPARRVFVYLDPPFAIRQGFGEIYERVLALITRLGSAQCELLIAIEHMSELELPLKIGDFALLKSRKFGATTMSYYAK
ncbi:RsmD family RNA methyltransferase, partial [uncultured Campylobacter sp.]|uniref:RsmD family RNA methyltransferase n=1 Tax=uncultured Campylobacter sp. TaxID=218934 RepID=UPI0026061B4E